MLLYYITNRRQFSSNETDCRRALLERIEAAASASVDYVELREVDLTPQQLEKLAAEALKAVRASSVRTRLLINSRIDVALAIGADGVHLASSDLRASEARSIWALSLRAGNTGIAPTPVISVECHSPEDVRSSESHGADLAVFASVFNTQGSDASSTDLSALRFATMKGVPVDTRVEAGDHRVRIPVLASGGVSTRNAQLCLAAGAAGVAGTRLFQTEELTDTVKLLAKLR